MKVFLTWVSHNSDWIFSGIGVAIFSALVSIIFIRKKNKKNKTSINVKTEGEFAPGIVIGDYKAKSNK